MVYIVKLFRLAFDSSSTTERRCSSVSLSIAAFTGSRELDSCLYRGPGRVTSRVTVRSPDRGSTMEGLPARAALLVFSGVMAGLVPAIHALLAQARQERRGCPRQARAGRCAR